VVGAGEGRGGQSRECVCAEREGVGEGGWIAGETCWGPCAEGLGEGVELVLRVCFPHLDAFCLVVDEGLEGFVFEGELFERSETRAPAGGDAALRGYLAGGAARVWAA